MIEGIGVDIVDIARIEAAVKRQPRFARRILTETEFATFEQSQSRRGLEFLAGRFALKEAVAKAWGTGISDMLSWQDIETSRNERGKPEVRVKGAEQSRVHASLSHTDEQVVAYVIVEEEV
ncbi:holo-[acyl-carrier protein] synthase [Salsuginibacillus halophilus]|uniref:Holo-[acyl-carrier-protein] synthase n=1 Tax=Salsuginibacillus halophilus TaxID=517424 RepID=A0A2P8H894_9BACI|nr:holo-ACP synthase [Salsuginibacillus halophilus]PSL42455.1 holo-[acyl-carrier protein] synthase [Salsuginibacillus halophilus]